MDDFCPASGPDDDIALAREAIAAGDLRHAAFHAARALTADPGRREWLLILDQVIDAAAEPLDLFPLDEEGTAFPTAAAHAYALGRLGRVPEALDLLFKTILARPDVPYLGWATRWVQQPEAAGLDLRPITDFLLHLEKNYAALMSRDEGGRATLDGAAKFIQAVRQAHKPDGRFLLAGAALLRRHGYHDEALALARAGYAREPGYASAVAVAAVHEARRELEPALAAYRAALRAQPDDVSARLRMADLLRERDRLDEARRLYDEVLEREPDHPAALPASYLVRFQTEGREEWRDKLLTLAEEQPDNGAARWLARRAMPYFGYLPEPAEITTKLLSAAAEKGEQVTRLDLPYLEAPSNSLAFDSLRQVERTVARVQTPDPRLPRRPVDFLLWRYDDFRPKVAVPPPHPAVARAIVEIAAQAYQLEAWAKQARRLAEQMRPALVPDLLATMVYPPRPPEVKRPWVWVPRVQLAAALVIAQLDEPWPRSARRKALRALANGPADWTTDAAVVALTVLAQDDEEVADEVAELFRTMRAELPADGPVCYFPALMYGSLRLPNLGADERTEVRQRLRDSAASGGR